jgi:hypothetical protein
VLDPSFTKTRGVFTKVTVVGIPSLLHLFATCEGFAQVTDFVITLETVFWESIYGLINQRSLWEDLDQLPHWQIVL